MHDVSSAIYSLVLFVFLLCFCQLTVSLKALCFLSVRPLRLSAYSSGQILLTGYLMNSSSSLDETYSKYSLVVVVRLQQAVELVKASTSTLVEVHCVAGDVCLFETLNLVRHCVFVCVCGTQATS